MKFHGKKTFMSDKEEVEILRERIMRTLISLRNKQGDCLGQFCEKPLKEPF